MSDDKHASDDDKRRIDALEAEVARLRSQVGAAGAEADVDMAAGGASSFAPKTSSARKLVIGAAILLASAAVIGGIFYALSSGFTSLAGQAADHLAPMFKPADDGGGRSTPKPKAVTFDPNTPRVPGL